MAEQARYSLLWTTRRPSRFRFPDLAISCSTNQNTVSYVRYTTVLLSVYTYKCSTARPYTDVLCWPVEEAKSESANPDVL